MNVRSTSLAIGLVGFGSLVGFGFGKVFADGIPDKDPLYYSGSLTENGQPVNSPRTIGINLYADQSAPTPFCQTVASNTEVVGGRFRVALASSCKSQINQNSGAWIEVIDGVTSLGRSKIGAVPYAVEADRAANASGVLATQIVQIQGEVHPPSAFRAWATTPVSIPVRTSTPVVFDHADYDLAGEYNALTGVFAPKQAGYYFMKCGFAFGTAIAGACAAALIKNGSELDARDVPQSTLFNAGVDVTAMAQLFPGDSVTCAAYQNSGGPQSLLTPAPQRNSFSAARLY